MIAHWLLVLTDEIQSEREWIQPIPVYILDSFVVLLHGIDNDLLEGVGCKANTICLKKLALELDPMQTEGVQETLQDVHHQKYWKGDAGKQTKSQIGGEPPNGHSG